MKRLEKTYNLAIKEKAAKLLGVDIRRIKKVIEHENGAGVAFSNGNSNIIPYEVWVLGWTEEEYVKARFAK